MWRTSASLGTYCDIIVLASPKYSLNKKMLVKFVKTVLCFSY